MVFKNKTANRYFLFIPRLLALFFMSWCNKFLFINIGAKVRFFFNTVGKIFLWGVWQIAQFCNGFLLLRASQSKWRQPWWTWGRCLKSQNSLPQRVFTKNTKHQWRHCGNDPQSPIRRFARGIPAFAGTDAKSSAIELARIAETRRRKTKSMTALSFVCTLCFYITNSYLFENKGIRDICGGLPFY